MADGIQAKRPMVGCRSERDQALAEWEASESMAAAQGARLLRQCQWRRPPALAALGNLKDRPFALSLPASTGSGRRESGGRCARPDNPDDAKREWELGSVVKEVLRVRVTWTDNQKATQMTKMIHPHACANCDDGFTGEAANSSAC